MLLPWSKVRAFFKVICDDGDVPPEVTQLPADAFWDFLTALPAVLADELKSFQYLFAVIARFDFNDGLFVETPHDGFPRNQTR